MQTFTNRDLKITYFVGFI